jgi:glycosyltransferase involved in cell wall biosynthesis
VPAREDRIVEVRREDDGAHAAESRSLAIGLLSPIQEVVPPDGYGGVESVVAALADGLVEAGHDVTLFAREGSKTMAKLVVTTDGLPEQPGRRLEAELEHAAESFLRAGELDVVSSHLGALGTTLPSTVPVIHTVSDPMDRARSLWQKLARLTPSLKLIAVSDRQRELAPDLPWAATIPNPVDASRYRFEERPEGYLAFLGRMSPDKGAEHAIAVAQGAGLPLKIGAKLREPHEQEYFDETVRPRLGDGVEFLGELDHDDKVELLGGAIATLFPAQIEEAFGLVLVESMACGTPVIALQNGAIPEVVVDGRTGFVVEDEAEMLEAVERVERIDRAACRRYVEVAFSPTRVVAAYERAFLAAA